MSTDGAVHQTTTNGTGGNTRKPCPLHGCKRVYTDTTALESHIRDHEIPAKSLPGKVLLCSTVGCSSSFPNMQKLMEHMRHHHKPNIFFLCESCRTKLRSYRGLLTHLHTCSKVPRPKAKSNETVLPFATTGTNLNMTHVGMGQNLLHPDSVSKPQEIPLQTPNQDSPAPSPVSAIAAPPLRSLFSSNQDSLPAQQKLKKEASDLLPSLNLVASAAALDPPDAQGQPQTQSGSTPQSPPGFSAVWKKSQGLTCNRRILWEHTKGRYKCVQCGHIVTNRKEMTQHINDQHRAAEDGGSSASNK